MKRCVLQIHWRQVCFKRGRLVFEEPQMVPVHASKHLCVSRFVPVFVRRLSEWEKPIGQQVLWNFCVLVCGMMLNAFFSGGLSEIPKVSKRGLWGGSNYIQAPAGLLQWGPLVFGRTAGGTKRRYVFVPNFLGMGETYWIVRVLSYFIREVFAFIYESKVKTQNSKQMVWAGFEKKGISLQK